MATEKKQPKKSATKKLISSKEVPGAVGLIINNYIVEDAKKKKVFTKKDVGLKTEKDAKSLTVKKISTKDDKGAEESKPKKTVKKTTLKAINEGEKALVKRTSRARALNEKMSSVADIKTSITNALATTVEAVKETVEKKLQTFKTATSPVSKIIFQVRYHTIIGQNLFVSGSTPLLGGYDSNKAFPLQYLNEEYWTGELIIPANTSVDPFSYKYMVKMGDRVVQEELISDKSFDPINYNVEEVRLIDLWNFAGFYENTFLTEPFKKVLLKNNFTPLANGKKVAYTHEFKVKAPLLQKNEVVAVYGSAVELGKWSETQGVTMTKGEEEDWWTIKVDLSKAAFPVAYKYGKYNVATGVFLEMEGDKNRLLHNSHVSEQVTVLSDGFAVFANDTFKGAGVAIPVFSLRSNSSLGVGEFNDIKLLVDWAKSVGLKVVQILPVNDTIATHTWVDSYPYAAISAFALHPLFLHLPHVVTADNEALLSSLFSIKKDLNLLNEVDYEKVLAAKLAFVKQIYPLQKNETFENSEFVAYFNENKHWLVPYAAFSYLRDEFGTPNFSGWPTNNTYNANQIQQLAGLPSEAIDEIGIHFFIQFHLHLQLKSATQYAHQNGIIVKGDIPIGIYRNSADAWQEPHLYNMDMQAGAPPDDFAIKGQNWGFPTYNWKQMQLDGFSWWKRRFAQMRYYFDAFRIDHILGFFRIWSIPMHAVEGVMGSFVPALTLHKNELHNNGIQLDITRLTKPYIHENILGEIFGDLTPRVKAEFLYENGFEHYTLKPEIDTQREVENYFAAKEDNTENHRLKYGLFDLISNVILFEVAGTEGNEFNCRIAMDATSSFRYLNNDVKQRLKNLYVNYFFRRQDGFWKDQAMQKLPELKRSTNMLICGEDLGMVPDCVPGVMKQLGILSLEIQRMPKDPAKEFFHPNDAPYLSVVTPSTHDMSTIRGWWEEDMGKTTRFYHNQLGKWGDAPFFCEPEIARAIVVQHLYSPAMWSIFQLQDLFAIDGTLRVENPANERINVPANPKNYWRYRMHITLENLIEQLSFNSTLSTLIEQSGRR